MRFGVSAFQGEGRADIDNTRANQMNVVIILDWFSGKIKERCGADSHAYLHGLEGGCWSGEARPDVGLACEHPFRVLLQRCAEFYNQWVLVML